MANLTKIIYLSEAQKDELFTNGTVTVNGQTIVYNDNDLYVTPCDYGTNRKIWLTTTATVPTGAMAGDIVLVKTT